MDYGSLSWGRGLIFPVNVEGSNKQLIEMSRRHSRGESKESGKLKPVCTLKGHTNDVTSVDFSGRNLLATGSSDKTIRIYKWFPGDTFEELPHSPLRGHRYGINCICFSPYGTKLASASTDGQTYIWDVKTGENLVSLVICGESAGLRTCAFSPNSSLLATGGDSDTAAVWDVSTQLLLREIGSHEATVTSVAFTPDSCYLATGSSSGELRLWDGMYGHAHPLATQVEVHDLGITCLHFNPAIGKEETIVFGKQYLLASCGQDTDLHLWEVNVGGGSCLKSGESQTAAVKLHHTLCGHKAPIMTVRFNASGGLIVSASGDKTVRLWDAVKLVPLCVLEGHKRYVTSCAFSEDASLIAAGGGDRTTQVWRVPDATQLRQTSYSGAKQTAKILSKYPLDKDWEHKKLINWTPSDVSEWLGELGLAEYAPNFRAHEIDGREVMTLTDMVLESKLGVDALGHRNKILRFIRKHTRDDGGDEDKNLTKEFLCPITQEIMRDPVLCADGFSYEREALEAWLASGKRSSPMTNEALTHTVLTPNRTLRNLIQRYREENS